jgi:homoserine O-acetyltransferase
MKPMPVLPVAPATQTATIERFTLESGAVLHDAPVAYRTWGRLNARADNAVVVCHALTGSADVSDWWGDLLGPGRALDPERDFVVGLNVLGSPYGTAAPVTENLATGAPYGADFPRVTIRDTVRLHRRVLDRLGVREVALAAGGSMGGMQVLEWAFEKKDAGDPGNKPSSEPFVQALAPVAVGGRHAPWQIGWSEVQRQAIYADPRWQSGRYPLGDSPTSGLAAARMMAMVSYRSYASYQARFGRERMNAEPTAAAVSHGSSTGDDAQRPQRGRTAQNSTASKQPGDAPFAVESYLRYQGRKLAARFDARCYVRLTQQMDTHDVARGRGTYRDVLRRIEQPALVVGIDSDVLYPPAEQRALAEHLPNATLDLLSSPHGHDTFLIDTERLNERLRTWRQTA